MDETSRRLYPADAGVREARAGGERAGLVLVIRGETLFSVLFQDAGAEGEGTADAVVGGVGVCGRGRDGEYPVGVYRVREFLRRLYA